MMKLFLHTLVSVMFATAAAAQTYPSPTYKNVTVQENLNLPSKPANSVMVSPDGSAGAPTFRTLAPGDIPTLDAAKTGSGIFDTARIPSLDASKIGSGAFDPARIPSLDAAKITTGTFDAARIPSLDAAKITTGAFDPARIPSLDTSKLTTGVLPVARGGTGAATGAANLVFATPSGSSGAPSFRSLVDVDIPALAISKVTGLQAALDLKAALASPALTGVPTAPTATVGTNTTQIATTAFVLANAATPNFGTQTANTVFAGPTAGGAAAPGFRAMVANDIPALDAAKITSGVLPVANGGTGVTVETGSGAVVKATGPSLTGAVKISDVVGATRSLNFQTSGVDRWILRESAETESGANAGTNFEIVRRSDTGTNLGTPVFIERATGEVGINTSTPAFTLDVNGTFNVNGAATATSAARGDNDTTIATTAFVQTNKGRINPRDYGAACNGSTDDFTPLTNALAAAVANSSSLQIDCNLAVNSSITLNRDVIMEGSGAFTVGSGATVTFTRSFEGNRNVTLFAGVGLIDLSAAGVWEVSACWFGACSGAGDVASNIRKLFNSGMSGKNIVFPGGNYNLCSAIPVGTTAYVAVGTGSGQVGYPATNQSSVIIKQLNGFKVNARDFGIATFTTCASIAQNIAFLIDKSDHFEWVGGKFVGSRSGLSTSTVNAPFQLMNNQRFSIRNAVADSGYTDAGAFFEGDGNREFVIEDNIGAVGQGVDMAYSCNAVYRNNWFTGVSTDGNNIGLKAFSHIVDGPMIAPTNYITTGCAVAENVTVEDNRFENYISGVVIQEGKHWKINDNYLLNMKGAGGNQGTGILVNYVPSGSFSNVGKVPSNISIQGNQIDGLGTTVAGCGVNIGANAIANADVFNRFIINGNMISGSAGSTGICSDTNSGSKVSNFFVGINEYSNVGALMNANASSLAKPATLPR